MKNNLFNRVINKGASRDFNGGRTGVDTTVKHLFPLRRGTKGVCLRKVVSLLFIMFLSIPQMWGANEVTMVSSNLMGISGLSGSSAITLKNDKEQTYLLKNTSEETIATFTGNGCKWNDTKNKPSASSDTDYPMYIRFGSSGNLFECEPAAKFVKGGKVRLFISGEQTNTAKEYASVKIGSTELGTVMAYSAKATRGWQEFDIPATIDDVTAKITITRTDNTFFLWGIEILTNSAGPITEVCPEGLTISGPESVKEGKKLEITSELEKGNGDLSYQWYKNGAAISGATDETLTIASCYLSDAGTYSCQVSKAGCTDIATSNALSVEVEESSCPKTGELFSVAFTAIKDYSLNTTKTAEEEITSSYATTNGGKAYAGTNKNNDQTVSIKNQSSSMQFCWGSSNTYLKLELDCELRVGDVISFESTTNYELSFGLNTTRVTTPATASKTYTITATDGLANQTTIYVWRAVGSSTYGHSITITRPAPPAATPSFKTHPQSAQYDDDETIAALIAEATVTDAGTISYEWFQKGESENTKVGDGASYTPSVAGTYYCVATNTLADHKPASATSDDAVITIVKPEYAVMYDPNTEAGGSGMKAGFNVKKDDGHTVQTFAEREFTAPEGYAFRYWAITGVEGKTTIMPNETFTMPNNPVTLTAMYDVQHTVKFFDGANQLGADVLVWDGETLKVEDYKSREAQTLATFDKWYNESTFDTEANFATPITADKNFYGKWDKAYANTVDFVAAAKAAAQPNITEFLSDANYALASTTGVEWDKSNEFDTGLKLKNNAGNTISFNVEEGKLVIITMGKINGVNYSINGGAETAMTGASTAKDFYFYNDGEQSFVLKETSTAYNMFKAITITNPYKVTFTNGGEIEPMFFKGTALTLPAATGEGEFQGWFDAETGGNLIGKNGNLYTPTDSIELFAQFSIESTDNSLKTLKYGDTDIQLVEDQTTYNVVLLYKTAIPASVTYEANSEVATPAGEQTATVTNGTATFTITAENGDPATYIVNFTVAPKDGVSIIKGQVTGDNKVTITVGEGTGAASAVKSTSTYGDETGYKLNSRPAYIGIALAEGQFQAGDVVNVFVTTVANGGNDTNQPIRLYYGTNTDNLMAEGTSAMVQGVNTIVLTDNPETDAIYLCRGAEGKANENWNPYIAYIEVLRPMNPILTAISFNGVAGTISGNTITANLPFVTDFSKITITETIVSNDNNQVTKNYPETWVVGDNIVTLTDKDGDVTTYTVTLSRDEVSHDATLSSLKYGETEIALVDGQFEYDVELPYGTADVPALSAVKNAISAKDPVIVNAAAFVNYKATSTVTVTAEDGETTLIYTVNFSVDKNPTIVIFDGSTMSNMATSPDATTGLSWAIVGSTMAAGDKKATYQGVSYTRSLSLGNSSTTKHFTITIPENYEAQIHILMMTNSSDETRHAWLTNSADKGNFEDAILGLTSSSYTELGEGTTDWLKDGTYYLHADNTVNVFVLSAKMKKNAPKPVINGISDGTYCEGGDMPTLTVNAAVTEGTMYYQWYFENVAIPNATEASYNTDQTGNYYVVVTNKVDGLDDASVQSDNVVVASVAGTAITATHDGKAKAETPITISVEATGKNLTYAWYACDKQGNVFGDVLGNEESLNVTVAADDTYYKVIVSGDCGEPQNAVIKVETVPEIAPQVSVTATTTWDFSIAPKDAAAAASDGIKSTEANQVMANIPNVRLDDTFNSQALVMGNTGEYVYRSNKYECFQGKLLKFHVTVPGLVTISARKAGNGCDLTIGDKNFGEITTSIESYSAFVEAGDVVISVVGNQPIRIYTMTFTAATKIRSGLTNGKLVTMCQAQPIAKMWGGAAFDVEKPYSVGIVCLEAEMPLTAGKPYILLAEAPEIYVLYGEGDAVAEVVEANGLVGNLNTAEDNLMLPMLSEGKDTYIFSNNHLYKASGDNANFVAPDRAYLNYGAVEEDKSEPAAAPSRRRLSMGGVERGTATGWEKLMMNEGITKFIHNNHFFILREHKLFNAQGATMR
ncbi:MAG: hypothetical protein MJZ64_01440 [Paludibacteraceae bacterium]|nr:hypothetical protein [Paludibacteraceae bacterium]